MGKTNNVIIVVAGMKVLRFISWSRRLDRERSPSPFFDFSQFCLLYWSHGREVRIVGVFWGWMDLFLWGQVFNLPEDSRMLEGRGWKKGNLLPSRKLHRSILCMRKGMEYIWCRLSYHQLLTPSLVKLLLCLDQYPSKSGPRVVVVSGPNLSLSHPR